jgi:hypothetical protein
MGCGREMIYNVPRLGAAGGFIHKHTRELECSADDFEKPKNLKQGGVPDRVDGFTGPGSFYLANIELRDRSFVTPTGRRTES